MVIRWQRGFSYWTDQLLRHSPQRPTQKEVGCVWMCACLCVHQDMFVTLWVVCLCSESIPFFFLKKQWNAVTVPLNFWSGFCLLPMWSDCSLQYELKHNDDHTSLDIGFIFTVSEEMHPLSETFAFFPHFLSCSPSLSLSSFYIRWFSRHLRHWTNNIVQMKFPVRLIDVIKH